MSFGLTIKTRIALVVGFLGVLLLLGGLMGMLAVYRGNAAQKAMYQDQLAASVALARADVFYSRGYLVLYHIALTPDEPDVPDLAKRASGMFAESDKAWDSYRATPMSGEEKQLADNLATRRAAFAEGGYNALLSALASGRKDKLTSVVTVAMKPLFNATTEGVAALQAYQGKSAQLIYQASQAEFQLFVVSTCVGLAVALGASFYGWISLRRAITVPLNDALHHFDAIAAGDLTTRIEIRSRDEMGHLLTGLKKMQSSLALTVASVREGSEAIAGASSQIASGNLDLSARTEEQAASLQETAANMGELTETVRQNADNARQASALADNASETALQGNEVVERVVTTMIDISDSSSKIGDIIGMIEGIAFQTNILALNAAVEAARAGEQGRGFAVVASEVRSLAQRSSSAAKEIKELIGNAAQRVETGSTFAGQAGQTMHDVIAAIRKVSDIMDEISSASSEQSKGIEQVAHAVVQMDEVTQQNAALVEQAAAAGQSLEMQAARLNSTVAIFKISANV
jgi:methyl-accepting chemotaxis protein-1 (serine sensor receptor)